jgi:cyclic pyranopterin phosphate synthase
VPFLQEEALTFFILGCRSDMLSVDRYERTISYLRVSVTDRCNLRCQYCMPPQGVPFKAHQDILRYEEIERIVRAAVALGIRRVRLTGGEPLVRAGIVDLVRMLAAVEGLEDLAMTTNGILLARYAADLRRAGLMRVNVSLDTLREDRYATITRGGDLADALQGITCAEEAGLTPLKLNVVILRGANDDEILDMARLTLEHPWHVRFIELMPLNDCGPSGRNAGDFEARYVPSHEVRARIVADLGEIDPAGPLFGGGPAEYYRLRGALGLLGFISPISHHFCAACNRLRLTADGRLRPCLLADHEIDLRTVVRGGAGIEEIQDILRGAIMAKPTGHHLDEKVMPQGRVMSQIGG